MKKYKCPCCGEKTITMWQKAFAGTQKSKGVICPNCGARCTNGMKSTIFRCIVSLVMIVVIVFSFIKFEANISAVIIIAALASYYVLIHLFDALFCPLDTSLRID